MVIQCCHCKGLLRVDEKGLPGDRKAKVRCPHCKGVGHAPDPKTVGQGGEGATPVSIAGPPYPSMTPVREIAPKAADWEDQHIPSDAFRSFRSPAKAPKEDSGKKSVGRKTKLIILALASVAVVGFFALLVNIILPGPAGRKPVVHTVPEEDQKPRSDIVEESLDPRKAKEYRDAIGGK